MRKIICSTSPQKTQHSLWNLPALAILLIPTLQLSSCALIEKSREARLENRGNTASGAQKSSDRFSENITNSPKTQIKRSYVNFDRETSKTSKYSDETIKLAYELGMDPKASLTSGELQAINDRKKVRELERRLDTNKERDQYSKVLPLFINDDERLRFLNIPSIEGRQAWINKMNLNSRIKAPTAEMKDAMESQDITLQMPMDYVRKAWGEPASVEVSGNPIYKNERWKYVRHVTTPDGFKSEKRLVYFESGRVVGWETE